MKITHAAKIILVVLAKDGMQLKPGLLYDSRQRKLIGSTLNLNHDYAKRGEPEKDTLTGSAEGRGWGGGLQPPPYFFENYKELLGKRVFSPPTLSH